MLWCNCENQFYSFIFVLKTTTVKIGCFYFMSAGIIDKFGMADIPPLSAMLPDSSDSREVQSGACGLHQDHLIAPDAGNHYNMLVHQPLSVIDVLPSLQVIYHY